MLENRLSLLRGARGGKRGRLCMNLGLKWCSLGHGGYHFLFRRGTVDIVADAGVGIDFCF